MNIYPRIRELVWDKLSVKTGWGRNEIKTLLDDVLLQVASEEISERTISASEKLSSEPIPSIPEPSDLGSDCPF